MTQETLTTIRAAEEAVTSLVAECGKGGPLYVESPKAVAQVSRTSKWLLNAITALRHELSRAGVDEQAKKP